MGPVILHGPEALERSRVLDEYPSPSGLLLWQALRDVHLWATVPEEHRLRLFAEGAADSRSAMIASTVLEPAATGPIRTLSALLETEGTSDPDELASACLALSDWASSSGRAATALEFAQAASLARPTVASDALRVAYLAQGLGEPARAETWFRRTVTVARQSVDRDSYALGLVGLGRLYRSRGMPRVAQRFFIRAQRAAVRWGLRSTRLDVLLELFGIAAELDRHVTAEQHARAAFELAAADGTPIPGLAHEVAQLWLSRGAFAEARQVLEALRGSDADPDHRVQLIADLVWALGGAGERGSFERVWGQAWEELGAVQQGTTRARALLSLASGAALMQDAGRALHAAEQAVIAARESGDRKIRQSAENALKSLREGEAFPILPATERRGASTATRSFATSLVRSLAAAPGDDG